MKSFYLRALLSILLISGVNNWLHAQGFSFNCSRDTTIPGCNIVCFDLKGIVPDIYSSSTSYAQVPISNPGSCMPQYVAPNDPSGTSASLTVDDRYSSVINIGFPFPFYGTIYNTLIASTNGLISFDVSKAGAFAHWSIPAGATGNLPSSSYDRALIMGPYHDLHPYVGTSPNNRVQYQTLGTAPHRRWVLSFYKVPLFSSSCNSLIENTHQLVLYESTGVIEVLIFDKQICSSWNGGRSIVGIQDWNRTQGMMAPGRAATDPPWGSVGMNEAWRYVPSGGPSLFKRVELLDLAGTILSTGIVAPSASGCLEATFANTCVPASGLTSYIIRSVYTKNDDPAVEIFGTDTVRVHRVNAITANQSTTPTLCNGASDGTIAVTPLTGTPPYNYSLDGGTVVSSSGPHTFTNVSAGPHVVTITDMNGCPSTLNVTVAAGPGLTTTASKTDALCNGTATGTITVAQPTIGTPPFEYSLDGVNWQTSNVFPNVTANTYTVYFRSADICPGTTSVTVNEPSLLDGTSATTNGTCDGGADGTITVTASGGSPGYQYSIDGVNFQASNVFNVLPNASYTITVKDANGCLKTIPATVGLTNNLTFTPQTDPTICESKSTQLQIITNGTKYDWSPRLGLSDSTIFNPVASPVVTTQYTVKITKGLCVDYDDVIVNVHKAPVPDAGPDGFICYGQTYQLHAGNGVQYKWTPASYLDNVNIANPVSSPTKDVIYSLSIIADGNGCASLVTDEVNIDVTPPIKIKTSPVDTVVYQTDQFRLHAVSADPDVTFFNWTPSIGIDSPYIAHPTVTAGAIGDVVLYQVIGSTLAGCKGEGYIKVKVYKGPDLYVPTGFTPNGDGRNDILVPFPVGIKTLVYFRIFNRNGQQIFSTSRLHEGWDGSINGVKQASGTFVWMAEAITEQGKVITKKGVLTLLR